MEVATNILTSSVSSRGRGSCLNRGDVLLDSSAIKQSPVTLIYTVSSVCLSLFLGTLIMNLEGNQSELLLLLLFLAPALHNTQHSLLATNLLSSAASSSPSASDQLFINSSINSLQFIIPAWINYYEHDLTTATELFNDPRSGGRRGFSETELTLFHSWPSKFVGNLSGHTQATTPQQQRPRMKTIIAILIPIAISIPIQCRTRTAGRRRTVVDQEKSIEERRHIIFGISLSISTIKRNINDEIDGR